MAALAKMRGEDEKMDPDIMFDSEQRKSKSKEDENARLAEELFNDIDDVESGRPRVEAGPAGRPDDFVDSQEDDEEDKFGASLFHGALSFLSPHQSFSAEKTYETDTQTITTTVRPMNGSSSSDSHNGDSDSGQDSDNQQSNEEEEEEEKEEVKPPPKKKVVSNFPTSFQFGSLSAPKVAPSQSKAPSQSQSGMKRKANPSKQHFEPSKHKHQAKKPRRQ